jgi:hypothetical protein
MSEQPTSNKPKDYPPTRPGLVSYALMGVVLIGIGIFIFSQ